MKKSIFWLMGLLLSVSLAVTSCEETDGAVDPYFNWQERNELYIDSIARVANANLGNEVGQWKAVHTWKFIPPINDLNPDVNDYVYCRILAKGNGRKPLFTDSVAVNYRGWLIPLLNGATVTFDQSYQGELDRDIAIPVGFALDQAGLRVGWSTAMMQMREGDRWEVYIPYTLGYETYGQGDIPGYSTLIFDIDFVKTYPLEERGK